MQTLTKREICEYLPGKINVRLRARVRKAIAEDPTGERLAYINSLEAEAFPPETVDALTSLAIIAKASFTRQKKDEERREEVRAIARSGTCPQCGAGVKRNLSLTGWWQCEQFGSPAFRKDPAKDPCSWQGFTE